MFDAAMTMGHPRAYYPPVGATARKTPLGDDRRRVARMWPGGPAACHPTPRRGRRTCRRFHPAGPRRALLVACTALSIPARRQAGRLRRALIGHRPDLRSRESRLTNLSSIPKFAGQMQIIRVGFSGGGTDRRRKLALSRADVAGLITLAAPVDLPLGNNHQGVPHPGRTRDRPSPGWMGWSRLEIPSLHLFGGPRRRGGRRPCSHGC